MPEYTTFQDGGSNSLSHIKSELLVSYSKFPFKKNGFLDEAYSPRYNTQPFLLICLHRRKHRLCKEDRRAPTPVAAATTVPTSYYKSP